MRTPVPDDGDDLKPGSLEQSGEGGTGGTPAGLQRPGHLFEPFVHLLKLAAGVEVDGGVLQPSNPGPLRRASGPRRPGAPRLALPSQASGRTLLRRPRRRWPRLARPRPLRARTTPPALRPSSGALHRRGGLLSYDNHAADLLFQIVNRRYERRPIVLTTNLAFAEWSTVFPNATCATALIDRLTHHAEIIPIEGESYRKREAELAQKARRRGSKNGQN